MKTLAEILVNAKAICPTIDTDKAYASFEKDGAGWRFDIFKNEEHWLEHSAELIRERYKSKKVEFDFPVPCFVRWRDGFEMSLGGDNWEKLSSSFIG
jgi:hypothetical protein